MDQGWSYQFEAASYPRYRFYRQQMHRVFTRWKRIIETGNMQDCISQGRDIMQSITGATEQMRDKVNVTVFDIRMKSDAIELKLHVQSNTSYLTKTQTTLQSHLSDLQKTSEDKEYRPSVTVFAMPSTDYDKDIRDLDSKTVHLPVSQLKTFVIVFENEQVSYSFLTLKAAGFDIHKLHSTEQDAERSKQLSNQIQCLLEENVVTILERMADFNIPFILKPKREIEQSLQQAIYQKLGRLKNPFVVSDFSPSQVITTENKEITDQPRELSDAERDPVFHRNLLECIAKQTKCVVIETLSKKYGIKYSLLNELLNEGFFGYKRNVIETMQKIGLPTWPKDRPDSGLDACREFYFKCKESITKLIPEAEDYVKGKYETLVIVKQLQFELFGLLRHTSVAVCTIIPDIPKLPPDLQHELLQIPEVYGCGTLWGELVLHVTQDIPPQKQSDLKHAFEKHNYVHTFTTRLVEPCQEQAGVSIENGTGVRAKLLERTNSDGSAAHAHDGDTDHIYGTLECFVFITLANCESSDNSFTNDELHAITCAHCVSNCNPQVEFQLDPLQTKYKVLGTKTYELYVPHVFDVATVKVENSLVTKNSCHTALKKSDIKTSLCCKWSFHNETAVGMPVYKHGSASRLTRGICVSNDYTTKGTIWDNVSDSKAQAALDPAYTILICSVKEDLPQSEFREKLQPNESAESEPMQDRANQQSHENGFSKSGDSGSVVCEENINVDGVNVILLLHGEIKVKADTCNGAPAEIYSYSSSIKKTLERLEAKYLCKIRPACETRKATVECTSTSGR